MSTSCRNRNDRLIRDVSRLADPCMASYDTFYRLPDGSIWVLNSKANGYNEVFVAAEKVQSDWAQSDSDAQDYIKNKPDLDKKQDKLTAGANIVIEGTTISAMADTNSELQFDLAPDYVNGNDVRDVFKSELEVVKNSIDQDQFNMIICTDVHYEERFQPYYEASDLALTRISNSQYLSDKADVVVFNGDNCQSDSYSMANVRKQYDQFSEKVFGYDYKSDVFVTLGNHDDGSGRSAYRIRRRTLTPDDILKEDDFKKIFKTAELINGETRLNDDSLYCFKDYPEKKIRLIVLNSSDIPETMTNNDGTIKWRRWLTHAYLQKQLTWLANIALNNVPSDYHVMVVAHCPLQYGWDMKSSTHHNHDLVKNLLVAFRDGTAYSASSSDVDPEFKAAISVDYSKQGARNLVGFFSGHLHNEKNYKIDGINNVTCDNSIPDGSIRKVGMPDEDSQSIISIDTTKRVINIIGFGAAVNRSYSY